MKRIAKGIGTCLLVLIPLLFGISFAQAVGEAGEFTWDLTQWFANPAFGMAAIVAFVRWFRLRWPGIDGPIAVPALAIVVGALGGALGQFTGMLTVLPYAEWAFPIGGLSYGISLAVTGVLGVNLLELVSSKVGKTIIGLFVKGSDAPAAASSTRTDADQFIARSR